MAGVKKTVLVTGASGRVGTATLKELGKYADILDVRAGTRDPVGKAALKDLAPNITVVAADTDNLQHALSGVNYLFVIPPTCEGPGAIVEDIIKSAKTAGVSLLLLLAVDLPPNTVFGAQYAKMVAAAQASGIPTIRLNVTWFLENILHCFKIDEIKEHSTISEPLDGAVFHGETSVEDIGAVAAKILSDPTAHVGKTYPICSPPVCFNDVARVMSSALERTISYKQMSLEEWKTMFGEMCPQWMVDAMTEIYEFIQRGSPNMTPPDGPISVQNILGRPAKTMEEFVKSKAELFVTAS